MGIKKQCEWEHCKNTAKFYVHQPTLPQRLTTGEMETSPAGRSLLTCGKHLQKTIMELGNLPFRTRSSLSVTIQRH